MSGTNKTTEGFMTVDPSSVLRSDSDLLRQQREWVLRYSLEEFPGISVYGLLGQFVPRGDVSAPEIEQANTDGVGEQVGKI